MLGLSAAGIQPGTMYAASLGSANILFMLVLFAILDRGRIISPAYGRMNPKQIDRMRRLDSRRAVAAGAGR
jgi:hypothetical protein